MTDDSMVPDFIKRRRDEKRKEEEQKTFETQKALAAQLLIETRGPQYWQSFKEKLQIAVESLSALNLTGSFSSPLGDLKHIHIEVTRPSQFVKMSKADIHFDGGSISANGLIGQFLFVLTVDYRHEIGVHFPDRSTACASADFLVEYILGRMIDQVER